MAAGEDDLVSLLLPCVRVFKRLHGASSFPRTFHCEFEDDRVRLAADRLIRELATHQDSNSARLVIVEQRGVVPQPDGYHLRIEPGGIEIAGASAAGCFYGMQTLAQLARFGAGQRDISTLTPAPLSAAADFRPKRERGQLISNATYPLGRVCVLGCCEIEDWPDFATRGLLHDVTRGKVPTLSTLKMLADRLASLKCNQLQLYIEHAFVFEFDRGICDEQNGLTAVEIRELDEYCRERFIDLVPAVATLGHMGRILSLPQYRHLAEIEPKQRWEEMEWPARARGLTLDVLNPESHRLVERMWGEILDAFSSPVVNICGDEPWDLGKGRNKDRISDDRIGEVYIDHILRTHRICEGRGRKTQVWSDVVTKHPELFDRLPGDLTVLHWGYDDKADYEGTSKFVEAGLSTMLCPGTTGWKRVLNAMDLAERNISTFARAGRRQGAGGLINTDWGDHGHFNALGCSWHGIAGGAACGWRADQPTGDDFDDRFVRWFFADATSFDAAREAIACLRRASSIGERCETWRLLWQPLATVGDDGTLPAIEEADAAAAQATTAAGLLNTQPQGLDRDELRNACAAIDVFREKVRVARGERASGAIQDRIVDVADRVERSWNARNKPSGFGDILSALRRVRDELRV